MASSHLILSTTSGIELDDCFSILINGPVQYGVAPFSLILQLLITHEIGELRDCNEKRYGFVGPQMIHSKLDDFSRQMY
jgi:hypothetical protein